MRFPLVNCYAVYLSRAFIVKGKNSNTVYRLGSDYEAFVLFYTIVYTLNVYSALPPSELNYVALSPLNICALCILITRKTPPVCKGLLTETFTFY